MYSFSSVFGLAIAASPTRKSGHTAFPWHIPYESTILEAPVGAFA